MHIAELSSCEECKMIRRPVAAVTIELLRERILKRLSARDCHLLPDSSTVGGAQQHVVLFKPSA
jgi:hypothetical protein